MTLKIKNVFSNIFLFFVICYVHTQVVRELERNCPMLQEEMERIWNWIALGIIGGLMAFLIMYSRGWFTL